MPTLPSLEMNRLGAAVAAVAAVDMVKVPLEVIVEPLTSWRLPADVKVAMFTPVPSFSEVREWTA